MAFNLDRMFDFSSREIRRFAREHQSEIFYAFAIDENLLCLNSEECAAATLDEYQRRWDARARSIARWEDLTPDDLQDAEFTLKLAAKYERLDRSDTQACLRVINEERSRRRERGNPYRMPEGIAELRSNTGDWCYQGFAQMEAKHGFDIDAYNDHSGLDESEQVSSAYAVAVDRLVAMLRERDVFACLRTSADFYATRVEHDD